MEENPLSGYPSAERLRTRLTGNAPGVAEVDMRHVSSEKQSSNAPGFIALADFPSEVQPMLGSFDESGDGNLSVNELSNMVRSYTGLKAALDSKGHVSMEAIPHSLRPSLQVFDTNQDGMLDPTELHRAAELYKESKKEVTKLWKYVLLLAGVLFTVLLANACLTFVVVDLSKDIKVGANGAMEDKEGHPLKVANTDMHVEGSQLVADNGEALSTKAVSEIAAIDSRMPDEAFEEMKAFVVTNEGGAKLHLSVLGFARLPRETSTYGTVVVIVTSVGQVTIDGTVMSFEATVGPIFEQAGFLVSMTKRSLLGIYEMQGFFNSLPAFTTESGEEVKPNFASVQHVKYTRYLTCNYLHYDEDSCAGASQGVVSAPAWTNMAAGSRYAAVEGELWMTSSLAVETFKTPASGIEDLFHVKIHHPETSTVQKFTKSQLDSEMCGFPEYGDMKPFNPSEAVDFGYTQYMAQASIPGTHEEGRKFRISDPSEDGSVDIYEVDVDGHWRSRRWSFIKDSTVLWFVDFDVSTATYDDGVVIPATYRNFDNSTCNFEASLPKVNPFISELRQSESPFPPPYKTPVECNECFMKYHLRHLARKLVNYVGPQGEHINDWDAILTYLVQLDNTFYDVEGLMNYLNKDIENFADFLQTSGGNPDRQDRNMYVRNMFKRPEDQPYHPDPHAVVDAAARNAAAVKKKKLGQPAPAPAPASRHLSSFIEDEQSSRSSRSLQTHVEKFVIEGPAAGQCQDGVFSSGINFCSEWCNSGSNEQEYEFVREGGCAEPTTGWRNVYGVRQCAKSCKGYAYFTVATGGDENCHCSQVCNPSSDPGLTAFKFTTEGLGWPCGVNTIAASDNRNTDGEDYTCDCKGCGPAGRECSKFSCCAADDDTLTFGGDPWPCQLDVQYHYPHKSGACGIEVSCSKSYGIVDFSGGGSIGFQYDDTLSWEEQVLARYVVGGDWLGPICGGKIFVKAEVGCPESVCGKTVSEWLTLASLEISLSFSRFNWFEQYEVEGLRNKFGGDGIKQFMDQYKGKYDLDGLQIDGAATMELNLFFIKFEGSITASIQMHNGLNQLCKDIAEGAKDCDPLEVKDGGYTWLKRHLTAEDSAQHPPFIGRSLPSTDLPEEVAPVAALPMTMTERHHSRSLLGALSYGNWDWDSTKVRRCKDGSYHWACDHKDHPSQQQDDNGSSPRCRDQVPYGSRSIDFCSRWCNKAGKWDCGNNAFSCFQDGYYWSGGSDAPVPESCFREGWYADNGSNPPRFTKDLIMSYTDVVSAKFCQQMCAGNDMCHYFTWREQDGRCDFKGIDAGRWSLACKDKTSGEECRKDGVAILTPGAGHVSGPARCPWYEESDLGSVDYDQCFSAGYYADSGVRGPANSRHLNVADAKACQKLCQANAGCDLFTYRHSDKECHLKAADAGYTDRGPGKLTPADGHTSGPRYCRWEVEDAKQCQAVCKKQEKCEWFTYSVSDKACYLKGADAGAKPAETDFKAPFNIKMDYVEENGSGCAQDYGWKNVYSHEECAEACKEHPFFTVATGGDKNCKCSDVCEPGHFSGQTAYKYNPAFVSGPQDCPYDQDEYACSCAGCSGCSEYEQCEDYKWMTPKCEDNMWGERSCFGTGYFADSGTDPPANGEFRTADAAECQLKCQENSKCGLWTFRHHDTWCSLKGADAGYKNGPGAGMLTPAAAHTSGPKQCTSDPKDIIGRSGGVNLCSEWCGHSRGCNDLTVSGTEPWNLSRQDYTCNCAGCSICSDRRSGGGAQDAGVQFCSEYCNKDKNPQGGPGFVCGDNTVPATDPKNKDGRDYTCSCYGCNGCERPNTLTVDEVVKNLAKADHRGQNRPKGCHNPENDSFNELSIEVAGKSSAGICAGPMADWGLCPVFWQGKINLGKSRWYD